MMRWISSWLLALALSLTVATSAANDAAVTFEAAKKLYEARSYEKALALFQDAYATSKSPNARFFIARSLRELGRTPEAYDEMAATVREATALATSDPKYVPTRDSAAAELALLEAKVGRVVVAAPDAPGLEVTLNGKPVDRRRLSEVVAVAPGTVAIEARATGKAAVKREEKVTAGQLKTVSITFSDEAPKNGEEEPKVETPRPGGEISSDTNLVAGFKGLDGLRVHFGMTVVGGPNVYLPGSESQSFGAVSSVVGSFLFGLQGGLLYDRFDLRLEISPATWMPDTRILDAPVFQTNLSAGAHLALAGPVNWVLRGGVGMAVPVQSGVTLFVGRADLVAFSALVGPVLVELDAPTFRVVTDFKDVTLDPFFGTQLSLMLDDL